MHDSGYPPRLIRILCLAICLLLDAPATAAAADIVADPLASPRWTDMVRLYFPGGQVLFDERVRVIAPQVAENSMNVPVSVSLHGLEGVESVIVFADFNPIITILELTPVRPLSYFSFQFKLQQASPVRVAARTADGVWHVGGVRIDASGGGCTAPSAGRGSAGWQEVLGEVRGRIWTTAEGRRRLRVQIRHPMDTGLAPGIPAFYLRELRLTDAGGDPYATIHLHEPVSADPLLGFELPDGGAVRISGVDNNGNRVAAEIGP
jgi:sulfur-oxidizing protein SoxY